MRRSAFAAVLVALAFAAAGCGERTTVRIGVLVDCTGLVGSWHDGILAGAELPFLERNGQLHASDHGVVASARAGGRRVELVEGCTESGLYDRLLAEARRLVEQDHVDVLVGAFGTPDGIVLRDYLRRRPEVTGVFAATTAQAVTLRRPATNVFRFTPDGAQLSAGLGTYAYRTLGWRTADVIDDALPYSWEGVAGFVAEFCALGGRVLGRTEAPFEDPARAAAKVAPGADGTVVLLTGLTNPVGLFGALARHAPPARSVLTWRSTLSDPRVLNAAARLLSGVVLVSDTPAGSPAWRAFVRRFTQAFPAVPAGFISGLGLTYYTAVSATLEALAAAHGDVGGGQRSFRQALSALRLAAPQGTITLDRNRQVVAANYLLRIAAGRRGATLRTVRVVPAVEQTFSGYLSAAPEPSRHGPPCRRGPVPAWAR